mgnify:CR=1 FL=1
MFPLPPSAIKIYNSLFFGQKLKKLAAVQNEGVKIASLEKLREVNDHTYSLIKHAAVSAASIVDTVSPTINRAWRGLGYGLGAAVPIGIAGKYLIDEGAEKAHNTALKAGLGLATLGGGLYGLHRGLTRKDRRPQGNISYTKNDPNQEGASVSIQYPFSPDQLMKAGEENPLHKLAAMGYLNELIDGQLVKEASNPAILELRNTNVDNIVEIFEGLIG